MEPSAPLVLDIGVVLLLAAAAGLLARRAGLPAVVGYLVAGLVVSPFTPGYVADRHQIGLLADIGVVLLLFEVGIEVDLGRIRRQHGPLLWLAPLQIVASTAVCALALGWLGVPAFGAWLLGLSVAMSSSVVVVNITRSRRRTLDRATAQALLGWSVLQDVSGVVFAMVLLAAFGAGERSLPLAVAGFLVYAGLAAAAAWILPRVLRRVRDQPDIFLIVSIAVGLALAAVGAVLFAVPLALAAFVAGFAITEADDTAEARRQLLPFRDVFAVLFFVTLGSLIDPGSVPEALPFTALLVGLLIVTKSGLVYVLARLTHLVVRPAQLAAGLGQAGEFGFVLASIGVTAGVVQPADFTALLVVIVCTIAASAVLARRLHRTTLDTGAHALLGT